MKSLKNLFLLSLLVFLLKTEAYAVSEKRPLAEIKKSSPSLTVEEQTSLHREQEDETGDEEENPSKKARSATMPHISEPPSQATSEGQQGTASSSSSNLANTTAPVRFLRTSVIPTLRRFVLDQLMKLSPTDPVFRNGLPDELWGELIMPYFNKITEMIQDVHKACRTYAVYNRPLDVKGKSFLLQIKKALQQHKEGCRKKLSKATERNYPSALFRIDSMTKVFPELTSSIKHLKEQEDYNKQAKLAQESSQIERAALLKNIMPSLNWQGYLWFSIAVKKINLQRKLLQECSDAEIESSQKIVADEERKLAQITPIIERQKIFLGRVEEFKSVQQSALDISFQASYKILEDLDTASAAGDEETIQLLQQQLNAHDQTIKALLSTDPHVQRLQKKIMCGNEQVAATASIIVNLKVEQRRIASVRKGRITTMQNGEEQVMSESYVPIFELYKIPSSFLDKEITLLQEAQVDSLAGKDTLAVQKGILAARWHDLATKTAKLVNIVSQIGTFWSPEELLTQNETVLRDALIAREAQLATQADTLPVNRTMASLPWDFKKTFEENVAALPQEED